MSDIWGQSWLSLLGDTCDWILRSDRSGTLKQLIFSSGTYPEFDCRLIPGVSLYSLASNESHVKLESVLANSPCQEQLSHPANQQSTWRQINFVQTDANDLPVRISGCQPEKNTILIAAQSQKDLATSQQRLIKTQFTLQNDLSRLGDATQQYNLIFDLCSDAMMRIDPFTQRVLEANKAARRLFEIGESMVINSPLATMFDDDSSELLRVMFEQTRATGEAHELVATLAGNGQTVEVSLAYMHSSATPSIFARITPHKDEYEVDNTYSELKLIQLLKFTPDALVFCGPDGKIKSANQTFASFVQAPSVTLLKNTYLEDWMSRGSLDQTLLIEQLKEADQIDKFTTELIGRQGTTVPIELSGARTSERQDADFVLLIRSIAGRIESDSDTDMCVSPSAQSLKQLVGRIPLKELVRESTDMIEKLCIETALDMTRDNRASAANILGVSRQALYVKLRRLNMLDHDH